MQRNYSIDILKFICAILVVFLHSKYSFESVVRPLTRCAVPCFFMISGYFCHFKKGSDGLRLLIKKIKHILFLITVSLFIYLIWGFVNDGPSIFNRTFPVNYVRNFLFVGLPYFAIGAFFKNNPTYCFTNKKVLLGGGNFIFSYISFREIYTNTD